MTENFTRDFAFERSTKHTHVFVEIVPPGAAKAIGTLYIQKCMTTADMSKRVLQVRVDILDQADVEADLETA